MKPDNKEYKLSIWEKIAIIVIVLVGVVLYISKIVYSK